MFTCVLNKYRNLNTHRCFSRNGWMQVMVFGSREDQAGGVMQTAWKQEFVEGCKWMSLRLK